jgi:NAD kinase
LSSAFTWNKGGTGALVTLAGELITVSSSIPSAPGSRPEATIDGASFRIKVARCRKQDAGFVIDGRLIDTVREVRLDLERRLSN